MGMPYTDNSGGGACRTPLGLAHFQCEVIFDPRKP